ncbi:MAG: FRG domain-containing protein [Terriglobales bacterium]
MVLFDKNAFLRALNLSLIETLPTIVEPGSSSFCRYEGKRPLQAIAQGVASVISGKIVELASDFLGPREPWKLLRPLLEGETLILIHAGVSLIPARLAKYWPQYAENPKSYSAAITENLVLDSSLTIKKPGSLVVVQTGAQTEELHQESLHFLFLRDADAEQFELAGRQFDAPITVVGIPPVYTDLCLGQTWRTEYEHAYRIYRNLVTFLSKSGSDAAVALSLADSALRTHQEKQILLQAQAYDLSSSLELVWGSVKVMRSIALELSGGRHEDDPLPDVYAAALSMRQGGDWNCEGERSLYRGQRNRTWRVVPTLYRRDAAGTKPDVEACMSRVSSFGYALKSLHPDLTADQYMAAAQHFGKEAGTKTPLIDVTWDAFVALFFASDGAEDGNIGVVDHLIIPEWRKQVASAPGERGFIKLIAVDAIQRIVRQRALFLVAPDPEVYERYIPYRIFFHQHRNLVFEDEEYEQPISSASLYPIDSSMQSVLDRFARQPSPPNTVVLSVPESNEVFGAEYLLERAYAMQPATRDCDTFHLSVLKTCAELLTHGPDWTDDPAMYSLRRWEECVNILAQSLRSGRRCPVREALKILLWRVADEKQDEILRRAQDIWRNTHGVTARIVADHLGELLLTKQSGMTAAINFAGSPSHIANVLSDLGEDSRWTLIDLRGISETRFLSLLGAIHQPATLLFATDETSPFPTPLRLVFKALMDGRNEVTYGEHTITLHPDTLLYLITWGRSFDYDSEARHVIDIWDEIDEFDGG